MVSNDGTDWNEMAAYQPELNEREKALRDLFVDEYLVDFNPYAAALRVGFMEAFAKEYATRFMAEPYVRKRIRLKTDGMETNSREFVGQQRNRIMQGLIKEANYTGPGASHAARVSALSKLATLLEMDPKNGAGVQGGPDGGVMVVPAMEDADSWSQAAENSQASLKATVKE